MRRSRMRGALVPTLVGSLAAAYLVDPLDPGPADALRARRADRASPRRQHHLHDFRDRRARPARPVAHAARRRAGAGRALLAAQSELARATGAPATRVCDNRRFRGVAQPGSALRSGRRGPQFESGHPDALPGPRRGPGSRLPDTCARERRRDEILAFLDAELETHRYRDYAPIGMQVIGAEQRRARGLRRLLDARGLRPRRGRGRAAAARAPRHVLGQRAARDRRAT